MEFEWDENKAKSNVLKHEIAFDEGTTVFDDDFSVTIIDGKHSVEEKRFITIGHSGSGRLLIVSHTLEENKIRIISVRRATSAERKNYENG